MTIDEAIEDLRYDAQCNRADLDIEWAERNEQLAEWLEELKEYKANNHRKCSECAGCTSWKCDCSNVRTKAIDDFVEQLKNSLIHNYKHFLTRDTDGFDWLTTDAVNTHIDEVAKQLKEGSADNEL